MSSVFWVLSLLLLVVAIVFLIKPLFRRQAELSVDYKESNIEMYNSKVKELDLDLKEERIDKAHYDMAVKELDHELLLDVRENVSNEDVTNENVISDDNKAVNNSPAKSRLVVASIVTIFIPVFTVLLYQHLSSGNGKDTKIHVDSGSVQQEAPDKNIELMIETLATELYRAGGTVEEWSMLGRSYKQIARYEDASAAFAEAIKIKPSARLYLERAEAIALQNNQSFVGEAREQIMKALELKPNSVNVLWFAGVAEFQSGNYGESIDFLIRLSAEAKEDEEINQSIRHYISEARKKLIESGVKDIPSVNELLATTSEETSAASSSQTASNGARLEVVVDINKEIRKQFNDDTVVFVYAKAKQGPQMPLAAQRLKLKDLPTTVVLDDSMAMMDGMNISSFPSVVVSARVSKTGSAISQPGDFIGSVEVGDVFNSNKLNVTISKQI